MMAKYVIDEFDKGALMLLDEDDVKRGLEGNLCRCGAYLRIVRAIETAAGEMREGA